MKNLFKHIIVPYLILWFIELAIILSFLIFSDHISITNSILYYYCPFIFIALNYWLCDRLIGIFPTSRERFDARFPGINWFSSFFRYIWPIISMTIPYILIAIFCYSGLYWKIQEKYYLWPEISNANFYSAKSFIIFILRFITQFSRIIPILILFSIYDSKGKNANVEKIILFISIFYFMISTISDNYIDFKNPILAIAIFLWFVIFNPRRPTRLFELSNLNYYFFTALSISIFINFSGFIFPYCYFISLLLAIYSFRAGWKAAIIGGICGLNIWSAIWWFFSVPDSIICRCKNCDHITFSCNDKCPKCKTELKYKVFPLISRLKTRIRPSGIIVIGSIIIILLSIKVSDLISELHLTSRHIVEKPKEIKVIAPYGITNIFIFKNNEIIGTNTIASNFARKERYLKKYKYSNENEEYGFLYKNRHQDNSIFVIGKKYDRKAYALLKKLYLADFHVMNLSKNDLPNCDDELIGLAYKYVTPINKSLYNCYDYLFSNYWYSLNYEDRKNRFDYYFKYNFPNLFLSMIAKYSEPEWFKDSSKMPERKSGWGNQKIYNENQIKKNLFSIISDKKFIVLSSDYSPICASTEIRGICANYQVRAHLSMIKMRYSNLKFELYKSQKVVLPYLRRQLSKKNFNKANTYLRILLMNPELFTKEDIKIIDSMANTKYRYANTKLIMALDRPELWDLIKKCTFRHGGGWYNLLPREFKSTNAFDVCCEIENDLRYSNDLYINIFSRIPNEIAINKVLNLIAKNRYEIKTVAQSDAINRAEIMRRFAEQSTDYEKLVDVICNYPFPGADNVLKSILDKCSEINKRKIDEFLKIIEQ